MNKGQSLFALAQLVAMIFVLSFAASAQQATEAVRRKALSEEARKFIAQNAEALGISKQPDAGKAGEPFSAAAPAIPFVYRYVSALAISPDFATDRTVFAAVYNGGVFKSTDAGLTWTAMNNGLDNFRVQALEVSPNFTVDQTLFVGTSDPPGAVGRTYRSTDGGGSWIKLTTGFAPSRVEDFAFSPDYASDQTIFAAAPGITKSTDGGNTWNSISPGGGRAVSIGLSPQYSFDQTIYMGTIWDLQKSTDDGNTWETLLSIGIGLPGDEFGDIAVSPNYAVDSTLFVTYPFGLLRSQDAGSAWVIVLPFATGQIVLSPAYTSDSTIFAGCASGVYKSTDGGNSWLLSDQGFTNLSIEALALTPDYPNESVLLAGTHDGVFRSDDETTWVAVNNGILLTDGIERVTESWYQIDTVPTTAVDNDGTVHIAWWGFYPQAGTPDGLTSDIHYTNNPGGSFIAPMLIPVQGGYYSIWASLATDADNFAHIAFERRESLNTDPDVALYYVTNRNGDFSNPNLVHQRQGPADSIGTPSLPSLVVDQNRNAHLSFHGSTSTSNIWYTNNVTGNFTPFVPLQGPTPRLSGWPSLAIDQPGNAHIVFRGDAPTFGDVFYTNNIAGDFDYGINISQNSDPEERPQLTLDGYERPHTVYMGLGSETFYSYMEVDSFAAPLQISQSGGRPSLALDRDERVHIAFLMGSKYASNRKGVFETVDLFEPPPLPDLNVGPRCIAISQNDTVHIVFSMRGSRITGDPNYEIYHIAFPMDALGLPEISIDDVTVVEGDSGTIDAEFRVSLSALSTQAITVDFATVDGTATAGSDYVDLSGTLTFAPGTPSLKINIQINGDQLAEDDENFFVELSNPTNATLGDSQGEGTIINDDALPDVLIWLPPDVSAPTNLAQKAQERNMSLAEVQALVKQQTSHTELQAALEANGKTVLVVSDITQFTLSQFEAVFVIAGAWPNNYRIPANGPEAQAIENYVLGGGNAYIEGNDVWYWDPIFGGHDFGPLFSLDGVNSSGGSFGTITGADFAAGLDFTYNCSSSSNDVIQPLDSAFVIHTNQSPAFDCGVASDKGAYKTIGVSHQFGCLTDGAATKTQLMAAYLDFFGLTGPSQPEISISDATVTEGDSGTVDASFAVTLSAVSSQTVTVDYATTDSSATAGSDYQQASGTLTFPPDTTSQTISVTVNGDLLDEPDELFLVDLGNPTNATLADSQGVGTITDDDSAPEISIDDVTVTEPDTGTVDAVFTVILSAISGQQVTVDFATADSTATAGSDYVAIPTTQLIFPPDTTSRTITVTVNSDSLDEPDEFFFVNLSNPTNAALADAQGIGTITDDDSAPEISISDATVTEGDSGTVDASFAVTLSAVSSQTVTVDYATADSSATAGSDYQQASGTLTFPPDTTSQTISVTVNGDLLDEPDELFLVDLSNPTNATLADSQGVGTITDDDESTGVTWLTPITIQAISSPNPLPEVSQFERAFGGHPDASDGFDAGLDSTAAPPAFDYYAFFSIPVLPNFLKNDYRGWISPFESDIDWTLLVVNALGITSEMTWVPDSLPPEGSFRLKEPIHGVDVDMRQQSSVQFTGNANLIIEYRSAPCLFFTFPIVGGAWYLVSLPVVPEDNALASLFPDAVAAFEWDFAGNNYVAVSALDPGRAYWLLMLQADTVEVCGQPFASYTTNYSNQGWDMIGGVLEPSEVVDDPDGSIISMFGWDAVAQNYVVVNPMIAEPQQGYWILVFGTPSTVSVGSGSSPVSRSAAKTGATVQADLAAFYQLYGTQPPLPPSSVGRNQFSVNSVPTEFRLEQNYPNPFNPSTMINYQLPMSSHVTVAIYDVLGQLVRTLVDGEVAAGSHSVVWDATGDNGQRVPSGVYFARMQMGGLVQMRKVLLLR